MCLQRRCLCPRIVLSFRILRLNLTMTKLELRDQKLRPTKIASSCCAFYCQPSSFHGNYHDTKRSRYHFFKKKGDFPSPDNLVSSSCSAASPTVVTLISFDNFLIALNGAMKFIDCRFQILGLFLNIVWVAFENFLFIILIFFPLICLKNVFSTLCWFLLKFKWFRRKKTHLFNNVFVTWGNCGIGNHTIYRYLKTIKLKAVFFTTRQRKVFCKNFWSQITWRAAIDEKGKKIC